MKKISLAVLMTALLMAIVLMGEWGFAFAAEAPAAAKSGPALKLDGFIIAGKLFDVQREEVGELDKINLTTQRGSFFVQSEIGARYGIVRPFIGYETLTHTYDKKSVGADLFFYSTEKFGSYGLRTSYTVTRRLGIDSQKYLFSGLIVKF